MLLGSINEARSIDRFNQLVPERLTDQFTRFSLRPFPLADCVLIRENPRRRSF